MDENKMSMDDLRHILCAVKNQEMTVTELRRILFGQDDSELKYDKQDFLLRLNDATRKVNNEKI